MLKRWTIKKRRSNDIITQLLLNRKVDLEKKEEFFSPSFDDNLHDPFKLSGIKKTISLIRKIRKVKTLVAIWGDYDTDGVTSTALLFETLEKLGIKPKVYIPTRKEGYGLNLGGIEQLAKDGIEVIFSVDCGITNKGEVEFAKEKGIKTVILDHHLPEKELPKAYAIVNPKLDNSKYPYSDLSACGVVFKLVQVLHKTYPKIISESFVKWSLDLVGISIAADVVPIQDENRTLLKYSLLVIPKTKRIGLEALLEAAGINRDKITTYTLGFQIGPRLNAPGRINDATLSFSLLITKDKKEAEKLAKKLNSENRKRQEILEKTLGEAEKKITKKDLKEKKIIIIGDKDWPSGVVGLIAGKLSEKYSRPALVFEKKEKTSQGSARSIKEFHVTNALRKCKNLLTGCGGHRQAAGFSFKNENLGAFKKKMEKTADQELKDEDLIPEIEIDIEIFLNDINLDLADELKKFEPTGFGNKRPLFVAKKAEIAEIRGVGNDCKHLKLRLKYNHEAIRAETEKETIDPTPYAPTHSAIGFEQGHWCDQLKRGDKIDLVFAIDIDEWNNQKRVDLKITDLKKSKK